MRVGAVTNQTTASILNNLSIYATGNIQTTGNLISNNLYSTGTIQSPYQILAPRSPIYQGSGLLTLASTVSVGIGSRYTAIDPTGRFLYASYTFINQIYQYSINTATGALTSLGTVNGITSQPGLYYICLLYTSDAADE